MGQCCTKAVSVKDDNLAGESTTTVQVSLPPEHNAGDGVVRKTPARSFSASPWQSPFPHGNSLPPGIAPSPARTPGRKSRWPLPPPSPAKPIISALRKLQGPAKPKEGPIPEEGGEVEPELNKVFGYGKNFGAKYELGKEVGRGHFGHTCWAKCKKGELKGEDVAVKIISKAKVRWYVFLKLIYLSLIA